MLPLINLLRRKVPVNAIMRALRRWQDPHSVIIELGLNKTPKLLRELYKVIQALKKSRGDRTTLRLVARALAQGKPCPLIPQPLGKPGRNSSAQGLRFRRDTCCGKKRRAVGAARPRAPALVMSKAKMLRLAAEVTN